MRTRAGGAALACWLVGAAVLAAQASGIRVTPSIADGQVFAGGFAQLVDEVGVVVRVHFQQMAGGRGGA